MGKLLIVLSLVLSGCVAPYVYNDSLSLEANAFYAQQHNMKRQRRAAAMREFSRALREESRRRSSCKMAGRVLVCGVY